MQQEKQTYQARCHCGAVRFTIRTDWPELTQCDCSICRMKNALMVMVHESELELLAGAESLSEYRFHTQTARHFFCKHCGIYTFHRKRLFPDHYGVNVQCVQDVDLQGMTPRMARGATLA